jgi:hypothetical protein
LESSCVRSGCGHDWTPRRDFVVSKSVGSAAFQKAGAHRVTLRVDPVRARHGPTSGPARVASGREPRLPLGAGAASIGWGKTLLATTLMAEFSIFSMGSTFRAISQERKPPMMQSRNQCLARFWSTVLALIPQPGWLECDARTPRHTGRDRRSSSPAASTVRRSHGWPQRRPAEAAGCGSSLPRIALRADHGGNFPDRPI